MAGPRMIFTEEVPHWLRRWARRWLRRIVPPEWTFRLSLTDNDTIERNYGKGAQAGSDILCDYLEAQIWLDEESPQDEDTLRYLLHEARHPHYQTLMLIFDQAWGRQKMTKEQAKRLFNDKIEELIQRDVSLFLKAWPDNEVKK